MKFGKQARQSTHVEDIRKPEPSRLKQMMDWVTGEDEVREANLRREKFIQGTSVGRMLRGNLKGRHRIRDEDTYLSKTQDKIKKSDTELGKLGRHADAVREDAELSYMEEARINREHKKNKDKRYRPYGPGGDYEGM
jgi:hypothetical protein